MTRPLARIGLAVALACAGTAQARPPQPTQASLTAAEDHLFAAQAAHDLPAITAGFAADGVFVHANGWHQTRDDFVAAVRDGKLAFKSVSATDRLARASGTLGMTRGTIHLVVGDMHLTGTYLAAWVWRDRRWQLLDWQSTPPSP
jgi:hypothetical protein